MLEKGGAVLLLLLAIAPTPDFRLGIDMYLGTRASSSVLHVYVPPSPRALVYVSFEFF